MLLGGDGRPLGAGAGGDHAVGRGRRLDDAVHGQRGVQLERQRLGGAQRRLRLGRALVGDADVADRRRARSRAARSRPRRARRGAAAPPVVPGSTRPTVPRWLEPTTTRSACSRSAVSVSARAGAAGTAIVRTGHAALRAARAPRRAGLGGLAQIGARRRTARWDRARQVGRGQQQRAVARVAQGLGEGDGFAASLGLVIADDDGAEHETTVRPAAPGPSGPLRSPPQRHCGSLRWRTHRVRRRAA